MCKEMERLAQCHTTPSSGLRQPWSVLSPTLTLYLSASPGPSGEKGEDDEPSPLGFLLQDPEEKTRTCLLVLYLFPHHTSHTCTHTLTGNPHQRTQQPCWAGDSEFGLCCCHCFAQKAGSLLKVSAGLAKRKLLTGWFSWVGRGDRLCQTPGSC